LWAQRFAHTGSLFASLYSVKGLSQGVLIGYMVRDCTDCMSPLTGTRYS
jgi:hypothetical protein